ncbi:hypothetical protein LOTGIDRAFT_84554, partial [Lottia gigantea]
MASFKTLPDNIILEIMSYLPVKDLSYICSVNRRWRRIVRDDSLWRHIDLSPYHLDLTRMWKVIRAHFSETLLTIKLKGFVKWGGPKYKKHTISNAMLDDLAKRCPNIKSILLYECNTDNLECTKLPITLKTLIIQDSIWRPGWFRTGNEVKPHPNLKHLDLSGCSRIDNQDINDFIVWEDLEVLVLNRCYRVSEEGIVTIATHFPKLKQLELSGTMLGELAIHQISRNKSQLEHLNIS